MDVLREGAQVMLDHWIMTSVTALAAFLTFDYISNFTEFKRSGLKGPPPLPLLGNFGQIMMETRGMHVYFQDLIKKYGKVFGIYFLKIPSIVVYDPEMNKAILVKEFDKFRDRPLTDMEKAEPLGSALTSLQGDKWKNARSILSPTFSSGKIKDMIFIMHEAADTLLEKMGKAAEEKYAFDIHEWQQTLTMEVILSTAFGVKTAAQTNPNDELMKLGRSAMGDGVFSMLVSLVPIIGPWLSQKLANSRYGMSFGPLADVARKIMKERKAHGSQRKDMLNLMLAAQDPDKSGRKLTEQEVVSQMIVFIMAGYDTSSNILGLTCYHFAIYPEIQEKVFEEIQDVCSLPDTCTYDEINKMPYLEACISETLRLYPPGFITAREVTEACTINGIYFRKGMSVFIPIHAMHHDEAYFPDPETYKPERFLPENKGSIDPYTYLPFGMGPRNCIGMRMALLEMRVILVRMLQKYRLVRGPETHVPISVKPRSVLSPSEPVMIRAEKRD